MDTQKRNMIFSDLAPKQKQEPEAKTKVGVCPDCDTEQELGLFAGIFYNFKANPVNDPVYGMRTAQRYRKVYICEQCAAEAIEGRWLH